MPVPEHLAAAASRLEAAERRLREAEREPSVESLQSAVDALREYVLALSDVQRFAHESLQERVEEIAGRLRVSAGVATPAMEG